MHRTTVGKLKPTIIVYCCLFIALTNCDNKQLSEDSSNHLASDPQSHEENAQPLPSQKIPAAPAPSNSVAKQSENENETDGKIASGNSPSGAKHETQIITSKPSNSTDSKVKTGENVDSTSPAPGKPGISRNMQPPMNNGALLRGASVFLGLSIVVIGYIIFRCARLNKNRTQMVRKYGVLAHRQDVEMRPLPLDDEDEDDTTVFDASEVAGIHEKQRRMT